MRDHCHTWGRSLLRALSAKVVIKTVCRDEAYPLSNRHVSTPRRHPGHHPLVCGSFLSGMSSTVSDQDWTSSQSRHDFFDDLLCYRKLVCTGVTRPFVVSSMSRNDEEVRAIGTEQHHGPVTSVTSATINDDLLRDHQRPRWTPQLAWTLRGTL
jgi:hypothetical protein